MPEKIPYLRVFISSPGDVREEREIATEVIESLPDRPFLRDRVAFRIVSWNRPGADTPMLATLTPQEAINQGLPKPSDCDIALVIFWSRMGTRFVDTDGQEYESGTHWELMDALKNPNCETIIYRRTQDVPFESDVDTDEAQSRRVRTFFESALFYEDGRILRGVNEYSDLDEFRRKLNTHLEEIVLRKLERPGGSTASLQDQHHIGKDRNRVAMIENVQRFWIDGVLENALDKSPFIQLGMVERSQAIEAPWNISLRTRESDQPLPPDPSIMAAFRQCNGKILILDEPGSGKTTLLLELARGLLENARRDPTHPIPVVFNLSSWVNKRQPLQDWMIDELGSRYQVPHRIAETWINGEEILPLLDGLDEVDATQRSACVEVINEFRSAHGFVEMAVCSRLADYEGLSSKLRMEGAVVLQPLSQPQIDDYLARGGVALALVKHVLETDEVLAQLVTSPLMLNIVTLAYDGVATNDPNKFREQDDRRQQLFDMYIDQALGRRIDPAKYTAKQTKHYLTTLAKKMVEGSQTVFYVEDIQPGWLQGWRQIASYVVALPILTISLSILFFSMPYVIPIYAGSLSSLGTILGANFLLFVVAPPVISGFFTLRWRQRRLRQNGDASRSHHLVVFTQLLLVVMTLAGLLLPLLTQSSHYSPVPVMAALGVCIPMVLTARITRRREQETGNFEWIGVLIVYILTLCVFFLLLGIGIMVIALLIQPTFSTLVTVVFSVLFFLIPATLFGLYFSIRYIFKRRVEPVEAIRWSWYRAFLGGTVFGGISSFASGAIVALAVVLIVLYSYPSNSSSVEDVNTFVHYLQTEVPRVSFFAGALAGGIAGFLVGAAVGGVRGTTVDTRIAVNEGIRRSWRLGLLTGALSIVVIEIVTVGLLVVTASGIARNVIENRSLGWSFLVVFVVIFVPIIGLILGLSNGGYAAIQHVALRLILWRFGKLPRDLKSFLDYAHERLLLYKVGGGYIFIHRMMLEHFANADDATTVP